VLLSTLGSILLKSGPFSDVIAPLRLRQFIAINLSDKVTVVTHPTIPQKVGLIPAGENFSYAAPPSSETGISEPSIVRKVKPTIWAAFVKPLDPDNRRYVDLSDDFLRFRDVPSGAAIPFARTTTVPRDMISDGSSPTYRPDTVLAHIAQWAKENDIFDDRLYIADRFFSGGLSGFFEQFAHLSESDLRRIDIPFDIIMKLTRRP
jgi:hypothetical protein